jgi:hypothetical protein
VAVAVIKLVDENSVPGVMSDEGGQKMKVFAIAFTVAPFCFWVGRQVADSNRSSLLQYRTCSQILYVVVLAQL